MIHTGGCHCGNIKLEFESVLSPAALPLRACQCDFCRRQGALSTSDPDGRIRLTVAEVTSIPCAGAANVSANGTVGSSQCRCSPTSKSRLPSRRSSRKNAT